MHVEEMRSRIEIYVSALAAIARSTPQSSLRERTVVLYLAHESTHVVAAQLRAEGYRLPDDRSIQPTHIRGLLEAESTGAWWGARALAMELFEKRVRGAHQRWN